MNFFNNYYQHHHHHHHHLQHPALTRPWSCPRPANQPLKCPLCFLSLEDGDVTSHFEEEVKQLENLRSHINSEWESKENNLNDVDDIKKELLNESEDGYKRSRLHSDNIKIPPCTRWQTYQRVKQNRHTRISGILRTKRYDEKVKMEDACASGSSLSSLSSTSSLSSALLPSSSSSATATTSSSTTLCKPVNRGIWTIVDNCLNE